MLLHALIGTDGHVHDLQVMQGPCSLAQSAVKAVNQWLYNPRCSREVPCKSIP